MKDLVKDLNKCVLVWLVYVLLSIILGSIAVGVWEGICYVF